MFKMPIGFQENVEKFGPYTPALRWGDIIFVSGQVGIDPTRNEPITGNFTAEVFQVLRNVKTLVESGGSSMEKVLKVNVYLTDMRNFEEMNKVYEEFFVDPRPARSTLEVGLPMKFRIEIDAIAVV